MNSQATASYKAYVLLILTTLFWAGNSIAGKFAVGHVSPMVIVSIRWAVVMTALFLFCRKQIAKDWPAIRSRLGFLLLLGTLGFTAYSVGLYYSLAYTTALNVSLLQGATPLFVFCAGFFFYSTRVSWPQAAGFTVSFVGVIAIAAQGDIDNIIALNINFGDLLIVVAVAIFGIYTAALRSKPQMHWTSLMFVLCLGASLSSLPLLAIEVAQNALIVPDATGWIVILYIVVFPSLLAQVFFIRAVELIGANRTSLFVNLLPVWGAVLAVTLVGEAFHIYHSIGLILILAGIGLAEYGNSSSPKVIHDPGESRCN